MNQKWSKSVVKAWYWPTPFWDRTRFPTGQGTSWAISCPTNDDVPVLSRRKCGHAGLGSAWDLLGGSPHESELDSGHTCNPIIYEVTPMKWDLLTWYADIVGNCQTYCKHQISQPKITHTTWIHSVCWCAFWIVVFPMWPIVTWSAIVAFFNNGKDDDKDKDKYIMMMMMMMMMTTVMVMVMVMMMMLHL